MVETLNDGVLKKLTGILGTSNDRIKAALIDNITVPPPANATLQDLWGIFLTQEGFTGGILQERINRFMASELGHDNGTYNDNQREYWNTTAVEDLVSSANLLQGIDITLGAGGTVAGNYTRTDLSGCLYYDDGTGVLKMAAVNAPYVNSHFGMYFELPSENALLQSNNFVDAYWTTSFATVADGVSTPPTGLGVATKLTEDAVSGIHAISSSSVVKTAGAYITQSWYVKADGRDRLELYVNDTANTLNRMEAKFYLSGSGSSSNTSAFGTWSDPVATIEPIAGSWYRVSISAETGTETTVLSRLLMLDDSGNENYVGDGVSGMYIWGAQLEDDTAVATTFMESSGINCNRGAGILNYPITGYDILPAPGNPYTFEANVISLYTANSDSTNGRIYNVAGETTRYLRYGGVAGGITGRYGGHNASGTATPGTAYVLAHSVGTANSIMRDGVVVGTQPDISGLTGVGTSLQIGYAGSTLIFTGFIKSFAFYSVALAE